MYVIKITTKYPASETYKRHLLQAVTEVDMAAQCQVDGAVRMISGEGTQPEQLASLLGIAVGGSRQDEIISLSLQYQRTA